MDPNANLAILRVLVGAVNASAAVLQPVTPSQVVLAEIAERFAALDNWLTSGGFQPTAWEKKDD